MKTDQIEAVKHEDATPQNDMKLQDASKVRKRKASKRKKIAENGKQNIRLPIKIEFADRMIEIAERRGMATTLALYREYIEEGIKRDLKDLANNEI